MSMVYGTGRRLSNGCRTGMRTETLYFLASVRIVQQWKSCFNLVMIFLFIFNSICGSAWTDVLPQEPLVLPQQQPPGYSS